MFCKLNEALCIYDDNFYYDEKNDLSNLAISYSVNFGAFLDDFTVFSFRGEFVRVISCGKYHLQLRAWIMQN